ncbi:hypothetical protein HanXRQr2_Chr14g0623821 [Helianthus annuus]|uniref:Uncharacterized protein n=1 Tax=Helianthus annuus TaxID=4232 RepID=A0A9K3E7N7_HELAN|nr:hypothetical protein HanXRQr2_Chr14g0623821 [Helianthus annuus]KAJ0838762.1 hypothetical protein HanPSC8_Chr14g0598641 [Helianthus annuus]
MAMEVVDVKAMASFETLGGGGVTVPVVASDWSSCLGCVVVVCPCVGHLSCLPYEHYLKRLIYASATY